MKTINFLKHKNIILAISLIVVFAGIIYGIATNYVFDIDFKGGTRIKVDLNEEYVESDIKDIVTLDDDNEYVVASKTIYNDRMYYYLVDINKPENLMFCYEDNGELVESNNKEVNTELLPLFYNASKNILQELSNNNNN